MKYFAYGSNMSLIRMRARVPSAGVIGIYSLRGHSLQFHKIGMDGTAKCDAHFTGNESDTVEGVLYVLAPDDVVSLDEVEGLGNGYLKRDVDLLDDHGCLTSAFTYFATKIDTSLRPFTWYKHHVATGAKQHGLSADYIADVEGVESIPDPDDARVRLELALYEQVLPDDRGRCTTKRT